MNVAKHALVFDEAAHRYSYGGKVVPSVTSILARAGLSDFSGIAPEVLRAAAERGTRVHLACELHDKGELDESSVIPEELGYLEAYRRFRRQTDFVPRFIEHRVFSARWWYAGTLDRIGTIKRKNVLLDIKTGGHYRAVGPQTAAYKAALTGPTSRLELPRFALYLNADGTYNLVSLTGRDDLAVFLAALRIAKWRSE